MSYKLKDVVVEFDNGRWVLRSKSKACYYVMLKGSTMSESIAAFPLDTDGLELAITYAGRGASTPISAQDAMNMADKLHGVADYSALGGV